MINASELQKKIGDAIVLRVNGTDKPVTVSGIYSDVTNGGKTAKATFADDSAEAMWSVVSASLSDESDVNDAVASYARDFSFAKVSNMQEYITQTFGGIIGAIKSASVAAAAVSLLLAFLVTLLFIKMLMAKDRGAIAILKACGFTSSDIRTQYMARSLCILFVAVVIGVVLANTAGAYLAGMLMLQFGSVLTQFTIEPITAYLVYPLMMIGVVLIATIFGVISVKTVKISENIKE